MPDKKNIMKTDWEDKAKENAYHWVDSSKPKWQKEAYYDKGSSDAEKLLIEFLNNKEYYLGKMKNMAALEIGCGTGRLVRRLAQDFGKVYGVDMIVGETTAKLADRYLYRELDRVQVKGKAKPVTILEPVGLAEEVDRETREHVRSFEHFLFLYRSQSWQSALKALRLLRRNQGNCTLFELYEERIGIFQDTPPGENWDGVFVHTSK